MLRPGRDYPQFRPGGAPPPMNTPMSAPLNVPMNAPMNIPMNIPPPFVPPPIGGRGFVMPYVSGGRFAYPPPPPTPVPSPHLASFLPSLQAQPFVPPLPQSPPVEAPPPPPPPIASPSAPPSPPLFATERIAIVKVAPPQLPAQPSKPTDPEILKNIEGMAEFVVRNGPRYESMARAKHAGDPKFAFLFDNDSGLEAVINRDFYKWKKEVFQLQSEAAAESQSNKHLDLESDTTGSQLTGQRALQSEEVPGSPAMSDMDMEDDLAAPSPKRDSPGLPRMASGVEPLSPELTSHFSRVGQSSQQVGVADIPESPLMSGADRQVTSQSLGKVESFSKSKRAQCRLTGDYTGSLIGNYLSDASEDSEDSEPSENLGMTESKSLDKRKEGMVSEQTASAHQVNPNTEAVEDMTLLNKSEAKSPGHGQSAELLLCANGSPFEAARGLKIIDDGDSKALEPQKSAGGIRREIGQSIQQNNLHRVEGASESPLEKIGSHQSRKRSRSYSRSRSRSRSRSHSRSRSRSRSASQSMEDGSKSPSPPRSSLHKELGSELMACSRTPPKDQANGAERDDVELKARGKRGAKGGGYNICLNYARGRCFRGDSCRFQHQGSEKGSDEAGKESEEHGVLKLTPSPQNLEGKSAVEVGNDAGHSAEKAGLKKVKHNYGASEKEGSSEDDASKRLESGVERVVMPPQESIPSYSVVRDDLVQTSAGGSSPAHEDEGAVPSAPPVEPPHLSEVALSSPLSPLDPSRQAVGNSSHVVQSHCSSGQLYPIGSEVSGFHQHNPSRFSGSSGVMPSLKPTMPMNNAYSNTDQSFGMTFPGGNHAQVHPPSSGIGENSRFQVYPTGSRYDYSDHARNYAPSLSSEYGSSFQAQSGISLAAPPSAFPPPPTGLSSSSAIRQQHDLSTDSIKGYTSFQHGFSSPFSPQTQQHHSLYPPSFPGDSLRHSRFSDVENHAFHGVYPSSSLTLSSQSQSSAPWTMPGPLNNLSSKVLEMPSIAGNSSSYSYALTTIPPLPSIIELPGTTKLSTSSDQYDPLADSFEPSLSGGSKVTSFNFSKTAEDGKSFGGLSNTLASHLENVSPGFDMGKVDVANMNEATGDPVVGIVENVSPPEDNRDWSPEQPVEAVETKQAQGSSKAKKNNSRGLKLLRSAVADHVKEVLKPTWKEGHMSKDAFKNIVKKAVDKVTAALPPHHIPKSQEKVDQFMSSSRMKIAKLVQGYIDKYQKT